MKTNTPNSIRTIGQTCLLALIATAAQVALAQSYAIDAYSIAGGTGTSTNGSYAVTGTIGQPSVGTMVGGSYSIKGGFWAVVQTPGAPMLSIERVAIGVRIFWPISTENFVVEAASNLGGPSPAAWGKVGVAYQTNANQISVTLPSEPGNRFFRLRNQP